jgi:hypothetical protein
MINIDQVVLKIIKHARELPLESAQGPLLGSFADTLHLSYHINVKQFTNGNSTIIIIITSWQQACMLSFVRHLFS